MNYITIERNEDLERARIRLKTYLSRPLSYYYSSEPPATLMGSEKVLSLRGRNNNEIVAKVDGPGFIIEELYKEFMFWRN